MRIIRIAVFICLSLIIFASGCGLKKTTLPDSSQTGIIPKTTPQMIEEYAMIHQMSDLKTAEHYLTHPDYAREHPYIPTAEDRAFYESRFLEVMNPRFSKLAEKEGAVMARRRIMGSGSSDHYGTDSGAKAVAEKLARKNELILSKFTKAKNLYRQGRIDDAITYMKVALEASPESPTMLYDLGVMLMKTGSNQEAAECFQKSIKILNCFSDLHR